jgi:hypothetical protein
MTDQPDGPYDDALLADGFERALLGFGVHFHSTVAVYDYEGCIKILQQRDGMSEDEAREFFEFNVVGAWMGPHTPVFVTHHATQANTTANTTPTAEQAVAQSQRTRDRTVSGR